MNETELSRPSRLGPQNNLREQIVYALTNIPQFAMARHLSVLAKAIGFSKACIYKFFDSQDAIVEHICRDLDPIVRGRDRWRARPPRQQFRAVQGVGLNRANLFFNDRKLYDVGLRRGEGCRLRALSSASRDLRTLIRQVAKPLSSNAKTPLMRQCTPFFRHAAQVNPLPSSTTSTS